MSDLRVHKRRVSVRVHLANLETEEGHLYSDVYRPDGSPATILDRLNSHTEKFVPLAVKDRHHLLNKSRVVCVAVSQEELGTTSVRGMTDLCVTADLANGLSFQGVIHAHLPPARSRLLDYLNFANQEFIPLWVDREAILLNADYIVGATETIVEGGDAAAERSSAVRSQSVALQESGSDGVVREPGSTSSDAGDQVQQGEARSDGTVLGTILKISDNGGCIELFDGSAWVVDTVDISTASGWLPATEVAINGLRMVRVRDGTSIGVVQVAEVAG